MRTGSFEISAVERMSMNSELCVMGYCRGTPAVVVGLSAKAIAAVSSLSKEYNEDRERPFLGKCETCIKSGG
jgi:hypothetical protein